MESNHFDLKAVFCAVDEDRDTVVLTINGEEVSTREAVVTLCDTYGMTTQDLATLMAVPVRTVEGWRTGRPSSILNRMRLGRAAQKLSEANPPQDFP